MTQALSFKNVKKEYDGGVQALKGVSLSVDEGEMFALLGPNGAGKTTLINIISGIIKKTSGEVLVSGHNIDRESEHDLAKKSLGLVPQEVNFSIFEKVNTVLIQQAGFFGIHKSVAAVRAEEILRALGLFEKKDVETRALSGGMKRRLLIARALMHNPKLLILDEPTAGVDIELRRGMWEYVRELNARGVTIILTTHYLEEAEQLCNKVAIINKGEIALSGTMKEVLSHAQTETFILDLEHPIHHINDLQEFTPVLTDEKTLEVTLKRGVPLNEVFAHLSKQAIKVESMRTKSNRLEELFVNLTKK